MIRIAQTELSKGIVAPALDIPGRQSRTRMSRPGAHGVRDDVQPQKVLPHFIRAVAAVVRISKAQLPRGIVAPALHRFIRQKHAGVKRSRRDGGGLGACRLGLGHRVACPGIAFFALATRRTAVFPCAERIADLREIGRAPFRTGFALPLARAGNAGLVDAFGLVDPLTLFIAALGRVPRAAKIVRCARRAYAVEAADVARRFRLPLSFGIAKLGCLRVDALLPTGHAVADACHGVRITRVVRARGALVYPLIRSITKLRSILETSPISRNAAARARDADLVHLARKALPLSQCVARLRGIAETTFRRGHTFALTRTIHAGLRDARARRFPFTLLITRRGCIADAYWRVARFAGHHAATADTCQLARLLLFPYSGFVAFSRRVPVAAFFVRRAFGDAIPVLT